MFHRGSKNNVKKPGLLKTRKYKKKTSAIQPDWDVC